MTPTETAAERAAFGQRATEPLRASIAAVLVRPFLDARSNVSRPKLLFAVAALDLMLILAASFAAAVAAAHLGENAAFAGARDGCIALLTITLLHRAWCYSVSALHRPSSQAIKIATAVPGVFLTVAGMSYVLSVAIVAPVHLTLWMALSVGGLVLMRVAVAAWVDALAKAGRLRQRTVIVGGGKEAVYAATKGAQINLGFSLDRELRAEGIRTTVIAPAGVNTPFAAADGRFGDLAPENGPFMETGDIAGAILYTLTQPRRMRTELWTMWSLAEKH
jgi:NAD(P)-dependent dehydrogenase (short-subunit alcohol dehydrogenase family)